MRFRILLALLASALAVSSPAFAQDGKQSRAVDVVICLDVSGSMEELLDATRARVWDVVAELSRMKPIPELRVGLLTFGSAAGTEESGWVVVQDDLTDDLDRVYASLMALGTEGSLEYVGRAVETALDTMSWSRDWNSLRIVFVAGNESADQGVESHDFRIMARAARDRGIIINALYAGDREQGVVEQWPELARLGAGNFSAIDPVTGRIQIPTPHDAPLLELNSRLNTTYVPYGPEGADGLANQVAQDGNASRLGVQSCSSRIVAKGSALYTNASWDLVDASIQEGFEWRSIESSELPAELQSLSQPELAAHVERKRAEREGIQEEIQRISEERETYIRGAMAERLAASDIGEAMRQAIREQAMSKGFTCGGC